MASQITNYQCPACTGPLHYAGDSGRLECEYCGSSYDVAYIEQLFAGKEQASVEAQAKIDERLLTAYQRIRSNMRNGLAVVTVKRDACGGCYNRIPPQRQVDIRQNKKIIVCEYCGRILVNEPAPEAE